MVIPKVMRDRLGLAPGDEVGFKDVEGGVVIEPVRARERTKLGRFRRRGLITDLERDHRRERKR